MSSTNFILAGIVLTPLFNFLYPHLLDTKYQYPLTITLLVSLVAYFTTITLIPSVKLMTLKKGLSGKDLNKGEAGKNIDMYLRR
jgi:hypothetical protein